MNTPVSKAIRKPIAVLVIVAGLLLILEGIGLLATAKKIEPLGWFIPSGAITAMGIYAYIRRSREERRLSGRSNPDQPVETTRGT